MLLTTLEAYLAHGGNTPQELLQRVEILFQFGMETGEECCAQQFTGGSVVALSHRAGQFKRRLPLTGAGDLAHGQELVSHSSHGADNHYRTLCQPAADDLAGASNGGSILQ